MPKNKMLSPFVVLSVFGVVLCGRSYADAGAKPALIGSTVIAPAIGQSFTPEESLTALKLPTKGSHRERILQSAANITSIIGWADASYMPGTVFGSIGFDDFVYVAASNYSGPNSFDLFLFLRSYGTGPRPWKLVAYEPAMQGDKYGYRIAYGTFDKRTRTVTLYDSSNNMIKKFDIKKAYEALRLHYIKPD